ncbi:hypothetical protein GA0115257_103917 [Streptomyces sp. LcepLS]|nr:hypothetical protein GA0115251_11165 [Streptomyces sp. TverLS-915]SCE88733.1 hypothetical protein GA0115257_103917 [Streptomyces sp. LcepLS]
MTPRALPRPTRTVLAGAVCAALLGGLGACGEDPDEGTNGVGKLSAEQIHRRTTAAAGGARSVRLKGNLISGGHTYTLDMRLTAEGGTGTVRTKGAAFSLLRVEKHLYLRASAAFWEHEAAQAKGGGSAKSAAGKLDKKYVKVPPKDPSYQRLSLFTDKKALLDGLLGLGGEVVDAGRGESGGVRTVRVAGDKGSGARIDVSLEGEPYPLKLRRAGDAGTVALSAWNAALDLKEPGLDETVDYGDRLLPQT